MTFPVDDILLGPRSFGRLHRLDGIIWHTGEEPDFDRRYAVSTAIYQLTHPGSYNFRLYDGGVMLNVPYLEASGGINPQSAAWAPGRFPFLAIDLGKAGPCPVRGCLGPYRNPTKHHLQASFVGKTAQLNAGEAPSNYLVDARRLMEWADALSNRGPAPLVHSKHGHWQTNRSDCGDWMYARLVAPEEADVPIITKTVREQWDIPAGTELWTGGPRMGERRVLDVANRLWSNGEADDGDWRRMEGAGPTLGQEFYINRWKMKPVPGTRNPATGYGPPVIVADCEGEVAQATQEAVARNNASWREWLGTAPHS